RVLRRRDRAGGRILPLQDRRAHVADRDLRAHGHPREPHPVGLDRRLPPSRVALRSRVAEGRNALRGARRAARVRRGGGVDAGHLGLASLELSRQGRARERSGRADGQRVRRQPPPSRARARGIELGLRGGRRALHRAQPHPGALADLFVDRRRVRRRHHRPARQCPGAARRLGLHRGERGADHGGHRAGLGAARVVHVADRDLAVPARAVSAARLPPVFVLVAAGLVLALVPAFKLPAFYESFLYLVFFWISLATSWNILSGYAGYFSFGHAAFFGAGVYTTATLTTAFNTPFLLSLPAAGLVAALLGSIIAAVVFRVRGVRGELFGLLTLAVTFVLSTIALNTRLDGGPRVWYGPALGAVSVTTLTQSLTGGESAVLNRALIGAILIAVIVFLPNGLAGGLQGRARRAAVASAGAVTAVAVAAKSEWAA